MPTLEAVPQILLLNTQIIITLQLLILNEKVYDLDITKNSHLTSIEVASFVSITPVIISIVSTNLQVYTPHVACSSSQSKITAANIHDIAVDAKITLIPYIIFNVLIIVNTLFNIIKMDRKNS